MTGVMAKIELDLAAEVGNELLKREWKIATAESCTGGGLSYAMTAVPGSSKWFECGFVTYSDHAKISMLGVNPLTIKAYGAVSEQTACEMATGAILKSQSQIAIAITGVAGPAGGSPLKPVGTVWIGIAEQTSVKAELHAFSGDRESVRLQSIEAALKKLLEKMK